MTAPCVSHGFLHGTSVLFFIYPAASVGQTATAGPVHVFALALNAYAAPP
jgi:hypothetical protein